MLTRQEVLFLDLFYREGFLHEDGHAHQEAIKKKITYDHCAALWHPYKAARGVLDLAPWEENFPPVPDDPKLLCPWTSSEEIEARIRELGCVMVSNPSVEAIV